MSLPSKPHAAIGTKNGWEALCHTHKTTCHKYMTYATMLPETMICAVKGKQGEFEAFETALD